MAAMESGKSDSGVEMKPVSMAPKKWATSREGTESMEGPCVLVDVAWVGLCEETCDFKVGQEGTCGPGTMG